MDDNGKITGVLHDDKITGVDSDNDRTGIKSESGSMGATYKADEMALIEEAISEAERDIVEGTYLLAGTETKTEDTWDENVIHPYLQVPTVEHTYNLRRRRYPRPDYTNRCGFQATIIHSAPTQLSMKRGLNKFKKRRKSGNCRTRTASQEGCIPTSENREPIRKTKAQVARSANVTKRKARQVDKGTWSSG